ncbi:MAG: hypothetical protein V9G12_10095 [Microthrixaceae bacterium]
MLVRAANSGRGAVNYIYNWHQVSCQTSSTCQTYSNSRPGNQRHAVVWTTTENGIGGNIYTHYDYGATSRRQ